MKTRSAAGRGISDCGWDTWLRFRKHQQIRALQPLPTTGRGKAALTAAYAVNTFSIAAETCVDRGFPLPRKEVSRLADTYDTKEAF